MHHGMDQAADQGTGDKACTWPWTDTMRVAMETGTRTNMDMWSAVVMTVRAAVSTRWHEK